MKRRLKQYRAQLEPDEVAAGINAARRNAGRLAEDAAQLLAAGRFPTAAALAVLAIEEAGKVSVLRSLALARDQKATVETWREYRSHTKKNASWILPQLAARGARRLEHFRSIFDERSDHPQLLDHVKQIAFYTDCLGDRHWSIPEQVIDEPLANMLVEIAKVLTGGREVTPKEIELWVKHLGPVWGRDMGWMKTALTKWHQEMVAHGLATEDDNSFDQFVWGGGSDEEQGV